MKRGFTWGLMWFSIALWFVAVLAVLCTWAVGNEGNYTHPPEKAAESVTEAGNVPATERCYMTEEEIQEDFENQKIEQALFDSGYFRRDIPLDGDTQAYLRAACEESGVPFELALAVIWQETRYQNIVGDGGDSIGYMQCQPKWHKERMERLGVKDLSEPFGNFRVGCDFLAELLDKYSMEDALSVYNSGKAGKSDYAKSVIEYMNNL